MFGSVPDPEFSGVRPSEHYVIGYLGVVMAQLGLVTLPAHIATHRELGVLRRYRASGVSGAALAASHAAVGTVLGLAGAAIVLAVGGAVYGVPSPDDPALAAGWLLAGLACFVAIGLGLGLLMPSSRAANAIGSLVFIPMFLLGGGGPPRAVMTAPMQAIADAMPLSHVVGGLRHAWLGADLRPPRPVVAGRRGRGRRRPRGPLDPPPGGVAVAAGDERSPSPRPRSALCGRCAIVTP